MVAATSFASLQMNWDAPDIIWVFGRFKQKCQLMFTSVLKDAGDEEKLATFYSGQEKKAWTFTTAGHLQNKIRKNLQLFSRSSRINWNRSHRYKLQEMRQEPGEPINNFISRIKNLAA